MSSSSLLHIALVCPEIAPNTGNIGRLCLALGASLHLVHPLGFQTDDKSVRRAGLDYWKHVDQTEYPDLPAFLQWAKGRRLHLFSSHGLRPYTAARHEQGDVLVFGSESVGLPETFLAGHERWRIPMPGRTRSLNLSNAVAVVAYGALQQISPQHFDPGLPGE